jgi:hypothetical protein
MPYSNNIRVDNICQDDSNYDKIKKLVRVSRLLRITGSAFNVLLYQIDQEFGFIKNGEQKDGDLISHMTRSRHLGISIDQDTDATKLLSKLNVLVVDKRHRRVSTYHINQDLSSWIVWVEEPTISVPDSNDVKADANIETEAQTEPIEPELTLPEISERDVAIKQVNVLERRVKPADWVDVDYGMLPFQVRDLEFKYKINITVITDWLNSKRVEKAQGYDFAITYYRLKSKILSKETMDSGNFIGAVLEV